MTVEVWNNSSYLQSFKVYLYTTGRDSGRYEHIKDEHGGIWKVGCPIQNAFATVEFQVSVTEARKQRR